MLSLRYAAAPPDLRHHISTYYLFRADLDNIVDTTRADLPQLRFMLSGSGFYTFGDGTIMDCPEAMLTGATTAATRFTAKGPLLVFGIGLLPSGWNALIGASAAEFTDRVEDARLVLGRAAQDMVEVLAESRRFEDMVWAMNPILKALLDRPRERPMDWFTGATDAWLTGRNSPRIDDLLNELGLSGRQVERLANRLYGAPPKLLARKYRTLRVASRLAAKELDWHGLVGDAFYDQSHLIREFKRFTGQTPRQLELDPSPVTRLMAARRKMGGILNPLALEG